MTPRLQRLLASPAGSMMVALLAFLAVFQLFHHVVTPTFVFFIAGLLVLGIMARPEYGLHLLVFVSVVSLAQYFQLPTLGPVSLPFAMVGALLLAFLIHLSLLRKKLYLNIAENWLICAFSLLVVFSMLMARHLGPENLSSFRRHYLLVIVVYFFIIQFIERRAAFLRLIGTLVAADLALVLSGILDYVGLLESTKSSALLEGRTVGFIGDPNELAFTLIGLSSLVVALVLHVRGRWARMALLVLAGANLFIILNTLSRGGFVSLVAVAVTMAFRVSHDRRIIALLLVLALVAYLLLPAQLFERFDKIQSLRGTSRWVLAVTGARMALAHPLLGVGYGNFGRESPRYDPYYHRGGTSAHNLYVSIASQIGLPALLLWLVLVWVAWWRVSALFHAFSREGERFLMLLAVALQANLVNLLVFGLSIHVEYTYMTFITLALIILADRLYRSRTVPAARTAPAPGPAAGLAGGGLSS
ncbi:MAG: O-antigen ligase family protein [Acidobacteriota bacterium]